MDEPKPGWQRVKFGDVVRQVKHKVPAKESGLDRYIAGEHMDSDNLKIRRWGEINDDYLGPAFHMRFKPGHVLYGSRRTYLRKVAVADFEGICANTTFVVESKKQDVLLPELLPFIMTTEAFHAHSKRESKGSVNPYVNFSDLAWYEFALPPPEEQARLVRALSSAEKVFQRTVELRAAAENAYRATLKTVFDRATRSLPLQSLCDLPITYGIVQAGPDLPEGVPYVRVSEMTTGNRLDATTMMKTSEEISNAYARTVLEQDDLVVALRGVAGLTHRVEADLAGANLSRGVARVSPRRSIEHDYVFWAMRSPHFQRDVIRYANGWKGESLREITIGALRKLPLPWLPTADQAHAVRTISVAYNATLAASQREERARQLLHAMKPYVEGPGAN